MSERSDEQVSGWTYERYLASRGSVDCDAERASYRSWCTAIREADADQVEFEFSQSRRRPLRQNPPPGPRPVLARFTPTEAERHAKRHAPVGETSDDRLFAAVAAVHADRARREQTAPCRCAICKDDPAQPAFVAGRRWS